MQVGELAQAATVRSLALMQRQVLYCPVCMGVTGPTHGDMVRDW